MCFVNLYLYVFRTHLYNQNNYMFMFFVWQKYSNINFYGQRCYSQHLCCNDNVLFLSVIRTSITSPWWWHCPMTHRHYSRFYVCAILFFLHFLKAPADQLSSPWLASPLDMRQPFFFVSKTHTWRDTSQQDETLNQCWFNVGSPSATAAQH